MKRNATGSLTDLYRHGLLIKDEVLVPKSQKYWDAQATVGENGVIWYGGRAYSSPSPAGKEVTGTNCNGWDFWHVFRDGRTGKYRPTKGIERFALIHGLEGGGNFLRDLLKKLQVDEEVDVSNVEMISLDALRNKLSQGFTRPPDTKHR